MAGRKRNAEELEVLEKTISRVQEFLKDWVQFERMLRDCHHNLNLTPEAEKQFIQLKSQCARRHEYLMDMLGRDYIAAERITPILQRAVTLRKMAESRLENYFNVQHEWNIRYLHLQESLATLLYRHEQLEA
jgi:hypothetical protein